MGQQRGVCGHVDHVGVALHAREECGLEQCGVEVVPLLAGAVAGILSGEDLGALAVIVVVSAARGEEPTLRTVEVLVHEVYLEASHLGPEVVEVGAFGVGARRAYDHDLGMGLAQHLDEALQTLRIFRPPLLVADAYIFEVEGFGMSHLGAQRTPFGIRGAVCELNEVEGVVYVWVEVAYGDMRLGRVVLVLARQTAVEDGQWLGTDILGQQEELIESHAVALVVVGEEAVAEGVLPAVDVQGAVLDGADGVLPVVSGLDVRALDDAAAREAEYARTRVGQSLYEILAQAVLAALPRVDGEERHMLQIDRAARGEEYAQVSLVQGAGGGEAQFIFFPLLRVDGEVGIGQGLRLLHRGVVYQLDAYALRLAAGPDRETVFAALHDTHAEESLVLDAGSHVRVVGGCEAYVVGVAVEGAVILDGDVAEGLPPHEALRELERAVLHHLGIETAVGAVVYILEEVSVHRGAYLGPDLARLDHHAVYGLRVCRRGGHGKCGCERCA